MPTMASQVNFKSRFCQVFDLIRGSDIQLFHIRAGLIGQIAGFTGHFLVYQNGLDQDFPILFRGPYDLLQFFNVVASRHEISKCVVSKGFCTPEDALSGHFLRNVT